MAQRDERASLEGSHSPQNNEHKSDEYSFTLQEEVKLNKKEALCIFFVIEKNFTLHTNYDQLKILLGHVCFASTLSFESINWYFDISNRLVMLLNLRYRQN